MAKNRVVIYQDEGAGWRYRLEAANGECVLQGEAHTTEHDARRAAIKAAELLEQAIDEGNIGPDVA